MRSKESEGFAFQNFTFVNECEGRGLRVSSDLGGIPVDGPHGRGGISIHTPTSELCQTPLQIKESLKKMASKENDCIGFGNVCIVAGGMSLPLCCLQERSHLTYENVYYGDTFL